MPSLYARATANPTGWQQWNAIIASTPALQNNSNMPFTATDGSDNPRQLGDFFYTNVDLANQFISALLNRVAVTLYLSKYWDDPWAMLEKGRIDNGEVIQEVFIKMAKPQRYNMKQAEEEVFKRAIPDVVSAFHGMNYQYLYPRTITTEELKMAFNSWDELSNFITKLIENMFVSANYDAYQVKKYLIARAIMDGYLATVQVPEITITSTEDEKRNAVAMARSTSNKMAIMGPNYNYFGVPNFSPYRDQVIIVAADAEGIIDVSVLAVSFQMDRAEFLTMHRLITEGFGVLDQERLAELFKDDPTYRPLTDEECEQLNTIPFAIFDRSWFQIYDYFNGIVNINNPMGLYWNYFLHVWKAIGISPFANAAAFVTAEPTVTNVAIAPAAVTISPGQSAKLSAVVTTSGFASQVVTWSSDNELVYVTQAGVVTASGAATGTATITATSVADSTKSATCAVTIAGPAAVPPSPGPGEVQAEATSKKKAAK